MTFQKFIETLNKLGAEQRPFLFITDFELQRPLVFQEDQLNPSELLFEIDRYSNHGKRPFTDGRPQILEKITEPFDNYHEKFANVYKHLHQGDSYLTNLTARTEVRLSHSLQDLYFLGKARYKLWFRDDFLVFSPECFVRIDDGRIYSYPMKGTIDASLPNAAEKILADEKELAEHVTIVDLIRNDLSRVARKVAVNRFRYIEEVKTNQKNLLQVSSEITGELAGHYQSRLGNILAELLPAGSVSGAPKKKTIQIIHETEKENRGYYTGVFGYFDGFRLNSGVMIRFIERSADKFIYRSGGGITTQSTAESEYLEIINKVYVPVD